MNPTPLYRRDIDGLRAVAVLSAIMFHASPALLRGGFTGVELFFVISGYLITGMILKDIDRQQFSFIEFYARRCRRIFPALALVLCACLVLGWFTLLVGDYQKLGGNVMAGSLFYSNIYLWQGTNYFDEDSQSNPLLHLWSLGVEEQFYLLWPLLLVLVRKARMNAMAFFSVMALASFALNAAFIHSDSVTVFYWLPTRFWELLLGAILVAVEMYGRRPFLSHHARELLSLAGAAAIIYALVIVTKGDFYPGWWALLPTLGTVCVIAAGPHTLLNRYALGNRLAVFIGRISYPLYLWHWPLLVFGRYDTSSTHTIYALALALVLSVLTYYYVEKPIRRNARMKSAAALLCVMGVITLMGLVVQFNGFAGRFPAIVQNLTSYAYNHAIPYRSGECFIENEHQTISPLCVDEQFGTPDHTSILLWGDSHAAMYYAGLKTWQATHPQIRMAQFTRYQCPPYYDYLDPDKPDTGCQEFTRSITDIARKLHPDIVLMAARWGKYKVGSMTDSVAKTVAMLKKAGVKKIVMIGTVPVWNHTLNQSLFLYFRQDLLHRIPDRMAFDQNPSSELGPAAGSPADNLSIPNQISPQALDDAMSRYATRFNITYVSVYRILCNKQGCVTKLGENAEDLVAWDRAHLTVRGSDYVISAFLPSALEP